MQEIKLQEAIFELFNGEEDLVEDLKLVRKTYADSLIHLNILKPEEEKLGRSSPSTHFIAKALFKSVPVWYFKCCLSSCALKIKIAKNVAMCCRIVVCV